jgi:Fe-Mn family superoxide dismutase
MTSMAPRHDGPRAPATAATRRLAPGYTLPELPYDYGALEPHYSGKALELHPGKHHAAYVENLNAALGHLAEARADAAWDAIVGMEKALGFNLSGHVLHSLFWKNLAPKAPPTPAGPLADAIAEFFGSFERMSQQLGKATTTVQGSGWGALAWEPLGKRLVVEQIYDHQGNIGSGSLPVVVIDAWEHAYYLQFQNRKEDYLKSVWKVLDWGEAARRFEACRGFTLV